MEDFTIEVQPRDTFGSRVSRNLRRQGKLPVVVYSQGKAAHSGLVSNRSFVQLAESARPSQVFTLKSPDSDLDGKIALVKSIQQEGVSGAVLHVDFQMLHEGQPVGLKVPLVIKGEAPGVKLQGGVLAVNCRDLEVVCRPSSIPQEIIVDVSNLALADRVVAGDLELPEGVRLAGSPKETIANVIVARAAKVAATEGEAEDEAADADEAAPETPAGDE